MNGNYFASLGLHEPWAIAPDYAQSFLPVLAQMLKGEKIDLAIGNSESRLKAKSYFIRADASEFDEADVDQTLNEAPAGAIAILNMNGPIMKHSQFCGPKGTLELAAELKSIYANPNFIAAIIKTESGGGQAFAVKPLTDMLEKRNKPVLIMAGNLLCSAAYYIAAYGDEIICDHPRSIIGCIGTMQSMVNTRPALEKMGVVFQDHYATQSTLKNKTFSDALKGDAKKLKADFLDPLAQDFIDDVKAERENISSNPTIFQGETFMAVVAKELGMVDYIGDMDFCIARARELSKNYQAPQNKNLNMKLLKVEALAGIENPTEAQLTEANAELTTAGVTNVTLVPDNLITEAAAVTTERDGLLVANQTLTADLATANTAKETADGNLALANTAKATADGLLVTANAEIVALKAKIAAGPGATHKPAADGIDDVVETEEEKSIQAQLDAMPHNQHADKFLG